jgi:hypothetical protein
MSAEQIWQARNKLDRISRELTETNSKSSVAPPPLWLDSAAVYKGAGPHPPLAIVVGVPRPGVRSVLGGRVAAATIEPCRHLQLEDVIWLGSFTGSRRSL